MASAVSLVALWCLVVAAELPPPDMERVRGVAPGDRALIDAGSCRSRTFATLLSRIRQTDVIVFVAVVRQLPSGLEGRLAFMGAAGGVRYLKVEVLPGASDEKTISEIAHELQHALEIGLHPEVRSVWQMEALYERIGERVQASRRYDTQAARTAGYRVRQELSEP